MQINFTINIDDRIIARIRKFFTKRNNIAFVFIGIIATTAIVYGATITKPWDFNDGDLIDADKINDNFDALYNKVNELGNEGNFATGMIITYIGSTAPDGWLLCNGNNIPGDSADPSDPYYKLHEMIPGGKTPDLRGRYIIGKFNGGSSIDPGDPRSGLENEAWCATNLGTSPYSWKRALTLNQMPEHYHGFAYNNHYDVFGSISSIRDGGGIEHDIINPPVDTSLLGMQNNTGQVTGIRGGSDVVYYVPPSMALNYIIKI